MPMHIAYGKPLRQRLVRTVLLSISLMVLISSGLVPLISSSDTAYAVTAQQCYDAFGQNTVWVASENTIAKRDLYNQCNGTFCSAVLDLTAPRKDRYIVNCTNPLSTGLTEAAQQATAAKMGPVRELVCGAGGGGDKAIEAYAACTAQLDSVFASCSSTGGPVTSAIEATAEATAACLAKQYPNIPTTELLTAVTNGRSTATGITDAAIAANQLRLKQDECAAKNPPQVYDEATKACVDAKSSDTKSTCNPDVLGGIGWIVCPATTWLAKLADQIYKFVSQFLVVKKSFYDTNSATYTAWAQFRDIANVMFIIGFVAVVVSQVTGAGISNYGLKRMLPRLIIMAILVNLSFVICTIAVDISNVLGATLMGMLSGLGGEPAGALTGWEKFFNTLLAATTLSVALALMLLSISIPVLLAGLLALVVVGFILIARQAILILLIAISPIAFALNLLPNTESWYKKWQKMFFSLLMVYPVTSALFGAGALASKVLGGVAAGDPVFGIASLAAAVLPLFVLPSILKGSLDATGALGAKMKGLGNKATGRVGKSIGENSQLGAYRNARKRNAQIKRASIQGGVYTGKNPLAKGASWANRRLNNSKLTGSMGTRTAQQGASMANKLEIENVEAANAQIEQANVNIDDLARIANGEKAAGLNGADASTRAAAMAGLAKRGEMGRLADSWDSVAANGTAEQKRVAANALGRSADRPQFIGQGALQDLREGGSTRFDAHAASGIRSGAYSAEGISKASSQELGYAHRVASQALAAGDNTPMQNLVNAAVAAKSDPSISKNISKNKAHIDEFSVGTLFDPSTLAGGQRNSSSRRSNDP